MKARRKYQIKDSPLFRLTRQSRLADLLGLSKSALVRLASNADSKYRLYEIQDPKPRLIEDPLPDLKAVQSRISNLLKRLEPPAYMHSETKGRSYVTNAAAHRSSEAIASFDVRKFYPSTSAERVFQFFRYDLECPDDVSAIFRRLLTFNGHLPTGGPASGILAYFAHRRMFDRVHELVESNGLRLSLYVDDVVISGDNVSGGLLYRIRREFERLNLTVHKQRITKGVARRVTGVVIADGQALLPNERHYEIKQCSDAFYSSSNGDERLLLLDRLLGRLSEASQIEPLRFSARRIYLQGIARQLRAQNSEKP